MGQGGRPNTCGAPGAVYWLREVRRAEDGVEIEVKWDVWYNGG